MNAVHPSEPKPLVTLFLVAYNQEETIEAAVESVLAQTYSPLEIIISDDCSSDRTFEIIEELAEGYDGPHDLRINRNNENLGIVGHVNKMFAMGSGELFVAAAGDDISFPERAEALVDLWLEHDKKPDGLCSGYIGATRSGEKKVPAPDSLSLTEHCLRGISPLLGATAAWSRRLVEQWGSLPSEGLVEDQIMALRALLGGGIATSDQTLVWSLREGCTRRAAPSWRIQQIWRLQRILAFLGVFRDDVQRWAGQSAANAAEGNTCLGLLTKARSRIDRDIRLLSGGRFLLLRYALVHCLGLSFAQGGFQPRVRRAAALLLHFFQFDSSESKLDPRDHRCLRPLGSIEMRHRGLLQFSEGSCPSTRQNSMVADEGRTQELVEGTQPPQGIESGLVEGVTSPLSERLDLLRGFSAPLSDDILLPESVVEVKEKKRSRVSAAVMAVVASYFTKFLSVLIGLVVTPIVLGYLGQEIYGFWAIVGSVIGYVGMVDFGITGSVATIIAREQREGGAVNRVTSNALMALSAAGLASIAIGAGASLLAPRLLNVSDSAYALISRLTLLAGVGLGASFPTRALKAALRGTQRIAALRVLEFLISLGRIAVMLWLLSLGHGVFALPWSVIVSSVVGYPVFWFAAQMMIPGFKLSWSVLSLDEIRRILGISAWWFLGSMGALFIYQTDNIVIGRYVGAAAVTIYALTFRVPEMIRGQLYQANLAIAPGVGDLVGRKKIARLQGIYLNGTRVVLFLGIVTSLLIVKLNRTFVNLWVGKENYGGDILSALFAGTLVYLVLFHFTSIILTNFLDLKVLAGTRFVEGIVNLVLSLLLVQRFGMIGVAAATLIAGMVSSAWFLPLRACRVLKMDPRVFLLRGIGRALVFFSLALLSYPLFPAHGSPRWPNLLGDALVFTTWLGVLGWFSLLPRSEIKGRLRSLATRWKVRSSLSGDSHPGLDCES